MRTTVRLSEELLRKAKKRAAEKGQTLTSLIEEGLQFVLANPARLPRRARVQVPISKASGGVMPGVDLNRASDLEDRMNGL
ncbi:MAG TPA: hypothetical protein VFA85_05970 [Terriglobales bacterium]|nr:hypothetical protein [Terriglobales bacterium]